MNEISLMGIAMSFLSRYRDGEEEAVWDDMVSLGSSIQNDAYREDAWSVVRETMLRVKHNVEILHQQLLLLDYRFVTPAGAYVPPSADVRTKIQQLKSRVGSLPMSVEAWFEIVGKVDFCGSHPDLSTYIPTEQTRAWYPDYNPHPYADVFPYYSDPLYFMDVEEALVLTHDFDSDTGTCALQILDWFHKANVSGAVYEISLPNSAVDVLVQYEPHQTTFVDYLRTSFTWGGFPGFELHSAERFEAWRQRWEAQPVYAGKSIPQKTLQRLSSSLLRI
ncbi:MAG: hypothetical protein SF123_24930 [Chloroflexota bacterium]|nr:hypothetical protein [Chloroflexota bacterium]